MILATLGWFYLRFPSWWNVLSAVIQAECVIQAYFGSFHFLSVEFNCFNFYIGPVKLTFKTTLVVKTHLYSVVIFKGEIPKQNYEYQKYHS